jgi:hypothetical protein
MSIKQAAYDLDPAMWARESFSLDLDSWQIRALRASAKRSIWNIHRQGGKSSVAAAKALHKNIFKPGSLVLMVSPSLRQSGELFRKWLSYYDQLDKPPGFKEDTKLSAELENGSRCISLPSSEATVRGFSAPALVIEDESARVTDDYHYSIKPMLAVSGGDLLLMSTPFGKRGHFFHIFTESGPEWLKILVRATECSRISKEFLEEERRSMPAAWFAAEYMCEFTETEDQLFSRDLIDEMLDPHIEPLFEKSVMDEPAMQSRTNLLDDNIQRLEWVKGW